MKSYLKPSQVAKIYSCHPDSVRKGRGVFGKLTRYRLGTELRFDAEEVQALIRPEAKDAAVERAKAGHAEHLRLLSSRAKERIK